MPDTVGEKIRDCQIVPSNDLLKDLFLHSTNIYCVLTLGGRQEQGILQWEKQTKFPALYVLHCNGGGLEGDSVL